MHWTSKPTAEMASLGAYSHMSLGFSFFFFLLCLLHLDIFHLISQSHFIITTLSFASIQKTCLFTFLLPQHAIQVEAVDDYKTYKHMHQSAYHNKWCMFDSVQGSVCWFAQLRTKRLKEHLHICKTNCREIIIISSVLTERYKSWLWKCHKMENKHLMYLKWEGYS